jgi:GT2 family glycosyltransferase
MKIVVGIATAGRRDILAETLRHIGLQSRLPDMVYVCPSTDADVDRESLDGLDIPVRIVAGNKGSCAQRNAILDVAGDADVIVFFDDDFLPAVSFLAETERLFSGNPEIIAATGRVLVDGIHGPGLSVAEGLDILAQDDGADAVGPFETVYNTYGCNMAFRVSAITQDGTRFDENLPLYGWQEDVDFCRRLAGKGAIVQSPALRGVHLGHKRGRTSGLRFGYSQVANPVYLVGKRTVSLKWALRLMGGNIAANVVGSLKPQGIVDRRGRLKGNMIAIFDMVTGRMKPQRVLGL